MLEKFDQKINHIFTTDKINKFKILKYVHYPNIIYYTTLHFHIYASPNIKISFTYNDELNRMVFLHNIINNIKTYSNKEYEFYDYNYNNNDDQRYFKMSGFLSDQTYQTLPINK